MATETTAEAEVMYVGPGGRMESQDDHDRRLAINAKMRFHRSLQRILSLLIPMLSYNILYIYYKYINLWCCYGLPTGISKGMYFNVCIHPGSSLGKQLPPAVLEKAKNRRHSYLALSWGGGALSCMYIYIYLFI